MERSRSENSVVIEVTAANLRHGHIYRNGCIDLFPKGAHGPASAKTGLGRLIRLGVAGLDEPVFTDLPIDAKSGKPRGFFRERSWVKRFFATQCLCAGDAIEITRTHPYRYEIRPHAERLQPTVAEFFAGIGLVRLALERRGFRVVFANDIDSKKWEVYRDNFDASDFVLGDIHALDPESVPNADLYTASFPCNDLSIAGAMMGLNGRASGAFWGLIDILKVKEQRGRLPRVILLENVPGFLMSRRGADLEAALGELCALGYGNDLLLIDAIRFVPQSRARLFIIATLGAAATPLFGLMDTTARPRAIMDFIHAHPNLRWSISDLPPLPHHAPDCRRSSRISRRTTRRGGARSASGTS